ncbi:MAG: 23S rRNA (adenine(2503)-C(2))-methyltransferase RlmN [Eubacterium sp.]
MTEKKDIKSYNLRELKEQLTEMGEKPFRASQIYKWLHIDKAESFDEMTNISKDLRKKLEENYEITTLEPVKVLISKIDGTRKYLFRIKGGSVIESVLMRYHHGNSVCISTQSGCRMGCRFCASTLNGLDRNLTVSELLEQIYQIEKNINEKVSNIVLMGSGEPLDNFDNVTKFLQMISDENGKNISQRNITLSTCGIVPKMKELADMHPQVTLALSLHASDDETRKKLLPIANKYSIEQVLDACRYYFDKTGRRITFEYSLVSGVNDTKEEADQLSGILKGINCHVNLIPVNPIKERDFVQSEKAAIQRFKSRLEKNSINVTIRREMGRDINGACGQLRNETMKNEEMKERKEALNE